MSNMSQLSQLDLWENNVDEDAVAEQLIKIINTNITTIFNKCCVCACDMGRDNHRQLCGKTYCINEE